MPFNPKFAAEEEKSLIEKLRKSRGCFNCGDKSASKVCIKCHVAVYCSRDCQIADWKRGLSSHKELCKIYCNNTTPECWRGPKGQEFPAAIGLASIGYIKEDMRNMAIKRRADAYLVEAKRVVDIGMTDEKYSKMFGASINIVANVVYNFEKPMLQCAVTVFDIEAPSSGGKMAPVSGDYKRVEYVVFEEIGRGGEDVQRLLHPPFGAGDISESCRKRAVKVLKSFIQKVNEHGLFVEQVFYQRGLMWMSDENFRQDGAKTLEKVNDGKTIDWNADMSYGMMDAMTQGSKAAFGGF